MPGPLSGRRLMSGSRPVEFARLSNGAPTNCRRSPWRAAGYGARLLGSSSERLSHLKDSATARRAAHPSHLVAGVRSTALAVEEMARRNGSLHGTTVTERASA